MERKIVITADGSSTIHLPDWDEQYHSKHGAIQEAKHVFIKHGFHHYLTLYPFEKYPVFILEIGFGTGLNAFITLLEAEKRHIYVNYVSVEAYPVEMDEINQLNYPTTLEAIEKAHIFKHLHELDWENKHQLTLSFCLTKQKKCFSEIKDLNTFNIIYFDAFGARVQPELWTESIFQKMYDALLPNGILVTYAAKGSVRRAMQTVGFKVEKLPGPPGKREMLRACKEA
tara:strand:- start:149 stop:832 length:684 start_codon:yes stop_codon:yes gene_type:complete